MAANGGTNDGPVGDRTMAVALVLAGVPAAKAREEAHHGGAVVTRRPALLLAASTRHRLELPGGISY